MKRFLLFVFAIVAFAACEQAPIEEQSAIRYEAPDTITVGFEGDDTRIQLNGAQKTVWNSGDEVSVFYHSNGNQKWQYKGEDGARQATLSCVQDATGNTAITKTIVVYPYDETYWLNTDSYCIEATTPATQHYAVDSYGVGDNLMVSQGEFTQFSLKNVYGWLKLQLTGDGEVIKSIKFRGNDGEQVAGLIYVDTATAEATLAAEMGDADDNNADSSLVFEDTILTEVILDCGEGVALGKEATAFYIALPPQTFEQGFTVEIKDTEGYIMEQSTDKALTIERNHIQPMAAFEFINPNPPTQSAPASNQIWYTSSDGDVVTPYYSHVFGANIISNKYNNGMGVITFDGDVTTIGNYAFAYCTSLTSVNIPDSVTTIGHYAFAYCYSMTSVNIPDSVTKIGICAFDNCDSLTSVNIPDSVTTIGDGAFYYCERLISVNIPDSVTTIGDHAFRDCTSLSSVNIPNSVTTIGYTAFYDCTSLISVTIGDSVTSIGEGAFAVCRSLKEFKGKYATEDGRSLIVDNTIIAYANASGTTYTIPDSVTAIGNCAFLSCDSLTIVNIPDSVTTIGDSAFEDCSSLTSVYCKATTPPSLDWNVFGNNGSGRKIYVPAVSVETYKSAECWSDYASDIVGYDFENGVVVDIPNNEIWYTATDKVVPNEDYFLGISCISNEWDAETSKGVITFDGEIIKIGDYAFDGCSCLMSIIIPESVIEIGCYAFWECSNLTAINIPCGVSGIFMGTFYGCSNLTSVTIPKDITSISEGAFENCSSLTNITIPESVTEIGGYAFYGCSSLKYVYCKATNPSDIYWDNEWCAFDNNAQARKIYVPYESAEAYRSAEGWSDYADAIVGYDFENGVVVE